MKRLFLMILLVMMVYWIAAARRREHKWSVEPPRHSNWYEPRPPRVVDTRGRSAAAASSDAKQAIAEARRAIDQARNDARHAIDDARNEARHALEQARREVHEAIHGGDNPKSSSRAYPQLEAAEGLPVPIVPGTRVTRAEPRPPAAPSAPVLPASPVPPVVPVFGKSGESAGANPRTVSGQLSPKSVITPNSFSLGANPHTVSGQLSASEERAKADARAALNRRVTEWLDPEVPGSWSPPSRLIDALILETRIKPVVKDYGTLYVAEMKVDLSPERRNALGEVYHGEQVRRRLATLGGILGFVLVCLAAISGYIRTDEATKGYYTNRLRMLTAAGVGAGGVIIYHMLA